MFRRILLASALAATLALGLAVAPAASARDSWSVSIGVPGVAVTAGSPYYYGPHYRPYYRPYYRSYYAPPPVVYRPVPVYRSYAYGYGPGYYGYRY
jgi:outer membrane scaffolding protein for murein synthesis (MipA/OmpV family)